MTRSSPVDEKSVIFPALDFAADYGDAEDGAEDDQLFIRRSARG
ncbi:MAG TPA: hypothetical protein VKY65_01760 [Alphaproteobacteria bacterium]|nr:hypothetical protein [Alphaproteobacteria bacterium]